MSDPAGTNWLSRFMQREIARERRRRTREPLLLRWVGKWHRWLIDREIRRERGAD